MIIKYLVFEPEFIGEISEEWRQCLKEIVYKWEIGFRLIKLNVFIDQSDYDTYIKVRKEIGKSIHNAFGKQCPAFNITAHSPEKPWKVVVEAGYSETDSAIIESKTWNSIPYVVCSSDLGKELWAGGLGFGLFYSIAKVLPEQHLIR